MFLRFIEGYLLFIIITVALSPISIISQMNLHGSQAFSTVVNIPVSLFLFLYDF